MADDSLQTLTKPTQRLVFLDVVRGLTVAFMIPCTASLLCELGKMKQKNDSLWMV
jgi:predicted acyltransferase